MLSESSSEFLRQVAAYTQQRSHLPEASPEPAELSAPRHLFVALNGKPFCRVDSALKEPCVLQLCGKEWGRWSMVRAAKRLCAEVSLSPSLPLFTHPSHPSLPRSPFSIGVRSHLAHVKRVCRCCLWASRPRPWACDLALAASHNSHCTSLFPSVSGIGVPICQRVYHLCPECCTCAPKASWKAPQQASKGAGADVTVQEVPDGAHAVARL